MEIFNKKNNYDFVAIGDTATDAFIQLKDATVDCDMDKKNCRICMKFGDKIPYEEVYVIPAVGNSANAAVSAARLGLKSALVANIGDDYYGRECMNVFKSEKIGTKFIKIHKGKKTNYHYILLFDGERTILIKHQEFEYALPKMGVPKWIYLSSMGANSLPLHSAIEKYLQANPEVKLVFQPGTYQMKFGKEALAGIYKRANLFFCNKDEAQRIFGTNEDDAKKLLKMIYDFGPKIVCVTDDAKGAYAYDGKNAWFIPIYPDPKPPIDRTGAGDAFSSTFSAAIAFGKSVEEALMWGPINSMSVVQYVGAREGLLTREKLEEYLKKAPDYYKPQLI